MNDTCLILIWLFDINKPPWGWGSIGVQDVSIRRVSSRQGIGTRGGGIVTKDSTSRKKFTNFYLEFLAGCWNTVQTIRIPRFTLVRSRWSILFIRLIISLVMQHRIGDQLHRISEALKLSAISVSTRAYSTNATHCSLKRKLDLSAAGPAASVSGWKTVFRDKIWQRHLRGLSGVTGYLEPLNFLHISTLPCSSNILTHC